MMKEIEIAQKLKKCNETIRSLYGAEFDKEILFYKNLIKACAKKHNLNSEIECAMKLVEESAGMEGADMFAVKIYAASVELMEGR